MPLASVTTCPIQSLDILNEATRTRWPSKPRKWHSGLSCFISLRLGPLSEINIKRIWEPKKADAIRQWGTPAHIAAKLTSIETDPDGIVLSPGNTIRLGRVGTGKYDIADGIHRVNIAQEIGLPFVLALTSDCEDT